MIKIITNEHEYSNKYHPNNMMFETKIRKWQPEDADILVELCKDHSIRKQWDYDCPYPYTLKKAEYCIQFFRNANPLRYRIFVILHHHEVCGWIQCEIIAHHCAKLTYFLADEYIRTSALRGAVRQMCTYCFTRWNVLSIYAKTAVDQKEMQNILLENNFVEIRDTAPIYIYFLHRFKQNKQKPKDVWAFPPPFSWKGSSNSSSGDVA